MPITCGGPVFALTAASVSLISEESGPHVGSSSCSTWKSSPADDASGGLPGIFRCETGESRVGANDQLRQIARRNVIAGDIGGDDLDGHLEDVSAIDCGQHRLVHRFTRHDVSKWHPRPSCAIRKDLRRVGCRPMTPSRIALASDHAGFALKSALLATLEAWQIDALDLGTTGTTPVDYPDYATRMVACLAEGRAGRGVLICGTGIGIAMAANRYSAVRAAVCHDVTSAVLARRHNDANVLALGGRLIGEETARQCLRAFVDTRFDGGRHTRRVDKLSHADHLR